MKKKVIKIGLLHKRNAHVEEKVNLNYNPMTNPSLREKKKTLLCYWHGEPLYEETAPREKLIELIRWQEACAVNQRKQHAKDLELLTSF